MDRRRVAVVTGASRGIGKQIALELARRGFDLVVAARSSTSSGKFPGSLTETVAAIEAVGGHAVAVAADLSVEADLEKITEQASSRFGRLDVLVNAAAFTTGRGWGAPLEELSREQWLVQYATNLHAPFSLMKAAVPLMEASGGGVIINLTSAAADMAPPGEGGGAGDLITGTAPLAYASSKAALNRLTNALAPQLRDKNIAVINVEPGFVRTEMVDVMEANGLDTTGSVPMSLPTLAVARIATIDDPMRWTGQVVSATEFA